MINIIIRKIVATVKKLSPQGILLLSFISVILLGSILLMQPFALNGRELSFVDSLFTSTSATCVTGLAVVDTGSHFSLIGQLIILTLIQLGGIGVMSFSMLFLFFIRGRFGISSREIIHETLSFFDTVNIGALLKSVFLFTITIEAFGSFFLTIRFLHYMPFNSALYAGIFHSISAFCNAGFSIFEDSFVNYRSDVYINFIISILVFLGGIGFVVLYELKSAGSFKKLRKRLSLHSKIVLKVSFFLILIGAIFIFIFEHNVSMAHMDWKTKIISSFFHSISSRTAGFNTIDCYNLSMPTLFFIIVLMFIGASPASTGGGVKTTTIAVLYTYIIARIKDSNNVNLSYSTLPSKVISKTIVIVTFAIFIIVLSSFLLTIIELEHIPFNANGDRFLEIFFEVVSAFGTVGLSTGITTDFSMLGRIIIVLLMLAGRVGPLTIAVAIGAKQGNDIKFAEDNILVG